MSDKYGTFCTSCDNRQPRSCGLCSACISNLQAENDRLREVLRKAGGLAEIDNWSERYPKVYGLMAELEENNDE
mgnify:CR=1 FL=1